MGSLIKIKKRSECQLLKNDFSVGIDFGTTYGVVCFYHNKKVSFACNKPQPQSSHKNTNFIYIDQLFNTSKNTHTTNIEDEVFSDATNLKDADINSLVGAYTIPSVVAFSKDGRILVGEDAIAQESNPEYKTIRSTKRLISATEKRQITEDQSLPKGWFLSSSGLASIKVFDKEFSCVEILSLIMKNLIQLANKSFPTIPITSAVITTPAYFGERSRNIIKNIAEGFGLNIKRVINEPTAAAICYGLNKLKRKEGSRYLIFDLGGGTFDVSVLRLQQGVFQVLSTGGDVFLGGDDFDKRLENLIRKKSGIEKESKEIEILALEAKHALSLSTKFVKQEGSKVLHITRKEFEGVTLDLVEKAIVIAKSTLTDSEMNESDINGIVLIGGATNMPMIKKKLRHAFGCKVFSNINPSLAVATGAALQAATLDGRLEDLVIIDITPLSLGIEMIGGVVEKVIPRNTPIPIKSSILTTTFQTNQTAIELNIVQGERELAKHCSKIGTLTVSNIEPCLAGLPQIEITFSMDVDGILTVEAKNIKTGESHKVVTNPTFNLQKSTIKNLINDGIKNREKDFKEIMKIKTITQALSAALHAKKTLKNIDTKQNKSFVKNAKLAIRDLETAINNKDIGQISLLHSRLEKMFSLALKESIKLS